MPELPEVEHLRRSLDPWLVGGRLGRVSIRRRGVVSRSDGRRGGDLVDDLLGRSTIVATHRHGKQMALEASTGAALVIQLGMTGSVTIERGSHPRGMEAKHRHVVWEFVPGKAPDRSDPRHGHGKLQWRLVFRDPRRFGGLTAYRSMAELRTKWSELGPDALTVSGAQLHAQLARSVRPIKSALLDQWAVAGVGNIYADEALFASRIHPLRPCTTLTAIEFNRLSDRLRRILALAVDAGGSTLRDYRDAFGEPGDAVQSHKVYGRAHEPCQDCDSKLLGLQVGGRTTVFCPMCQAHPI